MINRGYTCCVAYDLQKSSNTSTRTINFCLMNPGIHQFSFHQMFLNIFNMTDINGIIADREIVYHFIQSSFLMLLAVKSSGIFTKHNTYCFRFICFELMDFTLSAYKKLLAALLCRLKQLFWTLR